MTLGFGDYAQANFDFPGESRGDLSLRVGDVVRILDTIDKNWLVGEKVCHEVPPPSGSFPAAFVEQLVLPSVRTGQKIFLALADFMAEQPGDLELSKGDIITGIEAVDEAWWRGKNGPLKGIFPLSFVAELWHDDGLRSRSYSARAGSLKSRAGSLVGSRTNSIGGYGGLSVDSLGEGGLDSSITKVTEPTFATALVDVSPQLEGELAFQLGDLIEITEIIDSDWFFGRCHQKEGLVSALCVELLDDLNESAEAEKISGSGFSDCTSLNHDDLSTAPAPYPPPHQKVLHNIGEEEYRLRNSSTGSYTSENTRSHDAEIMPYGRVLYSFTAQGRSELSLHEGQIVTLIRHVDADWSEGEIDGRKGLFPTSFVEIVVDCAPLNTSQDEGYSDQQGKYNAGSPAVPSATSKDDGLSVIKNGVKSSNANSTGNESKQAGTVPDHKSPSNHGGMSAAITEVLEISADSEIGLVLHTFQAQMEGDVSVQEGETVEVVRQVDQNWLEVRTEASHKGMVPRNHVEIIGLWPKEDSGSRKSTAEATKNSLSADQRSSKYEPEVQSYESPSQACPMQEIRDPQSLKPMVSESRNTKAVSNVGPESLQPIPAPVSIKQPLSSPSKKSADLYIPNMLPKPVLPPKPILKPKPSSVAKPPMDRSQSLNSSKPTRPPPLVTAKPYSSLPRAKHHHVVSPNERRLSMSSLDSIIEVEMEKAKSRSSSQNSDTAKGKNSAMPINDSTCDKNGVHSANNSVSDATAANISGGISTMTNLNKRQSLPPSFESSDLRIPANAGTISKVLNPSKDHLCFDDDFGKTAIPDENLPLVTTTTSVVTSGRKPALLTSQSVAGDRPNCRTEADQRRKSASFAEHANIKLSLPTAVPEYGTSQTSFVNKAFEMDVDEGKLVDLGGDNRQLSKQKPPSRPNTAAPIPQPPLSSKTKAPPPRPSGPKIASAPSKVPLVPVRAAPTPPKLVPKRPAPKAPGAVTVVNASNNNADNKNNDKTVEIPAASPLLGKEELTASVGRPAPQPPVRQPPRPTSFATPPHRAPPPRPTDLIAFSPDESSSGQDEDDDISDETKKEMVRDLKTKLEENKADIKRQMYRTSA